MSRLFAGTEWDRPPTCDRCGKLLAECRCPPVAPPARPAGQVDAKGQKVTVRREKRQKGKEVTVVRGIDPARNDLPALLTKLKSSLGTGGSLDGNDLVVQGDQIERVVAALIKLGFQAK